MIKATHQGHCQWCGRLQMLPSGKLSKHGYDVRWGYFNGTCQGAESLPFEQDIRLIESAIKWAGMQLKDRIEEHSELCRNKKPSKVWVREYVGAQSRAAYLRGDSYLWRHLDRSEIIFTYGKISWKAAADSDAQNKNGMTETSTYGDRKPNEILHEMNGRKAQVVMKVAKELEQYISWQQARIKGWKPHPEKLVKVKPESRERIVHLVHPKHRHLVLCTNNSQRAAGMARTADQKAVTCVRCIKGIKAGYWGIKSELA